MPKHTCQSTYLPLSLYLPTYLHVNLPTYLSLSLPTYLPTYLPTSLPTYLSLYLHINLPFYLHLSLPTSLSTYLSLYLPLLNWRFIEFLSVWLSCRLFRKYFISKEILMGPQYRSAKRTNIVILFSAMLFQTDFLTYLRVLTLDDASSDLWDSVDRLEYHSMSNLAVTLSE